MVTWECQGPEHTTGAVDSPRIVLSLLILLLLVYRAVVFTSGATSHMCLTEALKHGQSEIQLML